MKTFILEELKYPNMREELIGYVIGLSDTEYQYAAWVKHSRPDVGYDELDYAIHFLYDDTDLANDPNSMIGIILTDKEESAAIANLITALDLVFDKHGTTLKDEEYLSKDEWKNVVIAAEKAKQILLNC